MSDNEYGLFIKTSYSFVPAYTPTNDAMFSADARCVDRVNGSVGPANIEARTTYILPLCSSCHIYQLDGRYGMCTMCYADTLALDREVE